MRLHNYLVNYRLNNNTTSENDGIIETNVFQQDILNSNAMPVIIGNDMGRPKGNISNDERLNQMKGCIIRDTLKIALQDHDMHRPKGMNGIHGIHHIPTGNSNITYNFH